MQRYILQLSYDGTTYHGWQVQENTVKTVQQMLNEMLSKLLNQTVFVTGCGRTDTGVHALEFFAHFDATNVDLKKDEEKWLFKFNKALPPDIAVQKIYPVKEDASTRFDAISRTYTYVINQKKNPFMVNKAYYIKGSFDVEKMNKAASLLYDFNDFSAFSKSNTQTHTNNCKITKAEWIEKNDEIVFTIIADRFLRNMVRAIVGTLLEVGKDKLSLEGFKTVIESEDRSSAGFSVHACGLYLTHVEYPSNYLND